MPTQCRLVQRAILTTILAAGAISLIAPHAFGDSSFQQTQQTTALGRTTGASVQAGPTSNSSGIVSQVALTIFGLATQALFAWMQPDNTVNGVTYTEFSSFGKRIFSLNGHLTTGTNSVSAGIAPVEVRIPAFAYPIGPVSLHVDAGARFQASLDAALTPVIGVPIELSSLGTQLSVKADAAGFIEGYLSLLVIRGGVGGQVNLIDTDVDLNARFSFDGTKPFINVVAWVEFLSGRLYAFLDYFNILKFRFKRLLNYDLYKWNGFCFATKNAQCTPL